MTLMKVRNSRQEVERAVQRLIVLVPMDAEDCGVECFGSTNTNVLLPDSENKMIPTNQFDQH